MDHRRDFDSKVPGVHDRSKTGVQAPAGVLVSAWVRSSPSLCWRARLSANMFNFAGHCPRGAIGLESPEGTLLLSQGLVTEAMLLQVELCVVQNRTCEAREALRCPSAAVRPVLRRELGLFAAQLALPSMVHGFRGPWRFGLHRSNLAAGTHQKPREQLVR